MWSTSSRLVFVLSRSRGIDTVFCVDTRWQRPSHVPSEAQHSRGVAVQHREFEEVRAGESFLPAFLEHLECSLQPSPPGCLLWDSVDERSGGEAWERIVTVTVGCNLDSVGALALSGLAAALPSTNEMGNASSNEPPPPPPPPATTATTAARLTRTLSHTALDIIADQAIKARDEREDFQRLAEVRLEALKAADEEVEQLKNYAIGAAMMTSVGAAILASGFTAFVVRRQGASTLAHVASEMVEIRRRGAAELERERRFGSAALAKSLIPALDAMDAMCSNAKDDEGASLTRATLQDALRSHGIERVLPAEGEKFDVSTMEAMMTVPVAEAEAAGTVRTVLRPGYVLHSERVLRAAQVGVGEQQEVKEAQAKDDA